jgi:hypothetical protein
MKKLLHFFRSNSFFQKKSGSFLADIMVSMGVLTMSITASITLINQSITTNSVNRNKVIAVNLAREGIEAVRTIRDTNWMRYGTKKRVCWNFWKNTNEDSIWTESGDAPTCENLGVEYEGYDGINRHPIGLAHREIENPPIDAVRIKNYLVVLDTTNYDWTLVENFYFFDEDFIEDKTCNNSELTNGDDCESELSRHWTKRVENITNTSSLPKSRLYLDSDTQLYTHDPDGNESTDFHREIYLTYPMGDGDFYPSSTDNDDIKFLDNQIVVTSKVWYRGHGGIMRNVVLETELTDYLERENWND